MAENPSLSEEGRPKLAAFWWSNRATHSPRRKHLLDKSLLGGYQVPIFGTFFFSPSLTIHSAPTSRLPR